MGFFCIMFDYRICVLVSLTISIRWTAWFWKDHVIVSCPALLLHSGLADPTCTWWWAALNRIKYTRWWKVWSLITFFATIAHLWVKNCKELLPSSSRPSRFDQPLQASHWLKNFKMTNERFLPKVQLDYCKTNLMWLLRPLEVAYFNRYFDLSLISIGQIKTTQRYVWTKRESTEEGRPLGELVDQVSFIIHHIKILF